MIIRPQQRFFLSDSKIHTVASSACVLPPPPYHAYEVFRVIDGVALFIEDHLERLRLSLKAIGIETDFQKLQKEIELLIQLNQYATGNIKIIFWQEANTVHNMLFYDIHLYPTEEQFRDGIRIGIMQHARTNPNVKIFDAAMRQQAQNKITEEDFYEILLVTPDGRITEGSRSNVFFIKDNVIYTPPSEQVLEGVTRKKVISIIRKHALDFHEQSITIDSLTEYESVFLTGTSRRVLPVHTIESIEKRFNTHHPIIRQLQQWFLQLCEEYIRTKK